MNEYDRIRLMHHQEYLLKQNNKRLVSKWQKARKLIKAASTAITSKEEAKLATALGMASKVMTFMQAIEENPPLKTIALKNMKGEPVWVVSYDEDGRWGIVNTTDETIDFIVNGEIEQESWFGGNYIFRYKKEIFDHSELLKEHGIQDEG